MKYRHGDSLDPNTVQVVPIVLSAPGEPEEVIYLERQNFGADEWKEIVKDHIQLRSIDRKLFTIECRRCYLRRALHVYNVKTESGATRLGYRCLACDKVFVNDGAVQRHPTELVLLTREQGAPQEEIHDVTWAVAPDGKMIEVSIHKKTRG